MGIIYELHLGALRQLIQPKEGGGHETIRKALQENGCFPKDFTVPCRT